MLETTITVDLPSKTMQRLQQSARRQKQSVADLVRNLVVQATTPLPTLPPDLEVELTAFAQLSDEILWTLARSALNATQQNRLAQLNSEAKERELLAEELAERDKLLDEYGRTLVRRAKAASLLKERGYDLSDLDRLGLASAGGLNKYAHNNHFCAG